MDRYEARKKTKIKRKSQACKIFEIKIDQSHLSMSIKRHLNSLFIEAKWFYNYCLSLDDVNDADTKTKFVPVRVKDRFEQRKFSVLKAQMKQSIKTRLFGSLKSLSTLKKNGHKVGRLKFKNNVNSVPLVQLGTKKHSGTFYLNKEKSRVRIQGMKQWIRVNGLKQIADNVDISCSVLVRKRNDYYLHVTTFESKQEQIVPECSTGIDFGCETQLTFSNGMKIKFQVKAPKRLKKLDRKIMRKTRKNSNNKTKDQLRRRKIYEHLTNRRKDIRHKGKKIQNSAIGGIIADLKHKSHTPLNFVQIVKQKINSH